MAKRVGLFGAGWAARAVYGPALRDYLARAGGIELAGVCDFVGLKAEEVRGEFGFERAYASAEEMFSQARLDAAIVAVSESQNAAAAAACLAQRLPTMMEKPPALTGDEVRQLAELAEAAGNQLMVAFNRRRAPVMTALRELIVAGGPLQSLRSQMRRVARKDANFSTTAVHAIDALRFLAGGDYQSLEILYGHCGPQGEAASYHCQGMIATTHNVAGASVPVQIEVVPMAGLDCEEYVATFGGRTVVASLGFSKSPDTLVEWSGGQRRELPVTMPSAARHDVGGFYQELAEFLDAVKDGRPLPGPTVRETIQSVEIMELLGIGGRDIQRGCEVSIRYGGLPNRVVRD